MNSLIKALLMLISSLSLRTASTTPTSSSERIRKSRLSKEFSLRQPAFVRERPDLPNNSRFFGAGLHDVSLPFHSCGMSLGTFVVDDSLLVAATNLTSVTESISTGA